MAKTKKAKKSSKDKKDINRKKIIYYEIKIICLLAITVLLGLSFHTNSVGIIGRYLNMLFKGLFSKSAYFIPYILFLTVFFRLNKNFKKHRNKYTSAFILLFISILLFFAINGYEEVKLFYNHNNINFFSIDSVKLSFEKGIDLGGGGVIGNILAYLFYNLVGEIGTYLIILVNLLIAFLLITNYSFKHSYKFIKNKTQKFSQEYKQKKIDQKIHINNRKINEIKNKSKRGKKKKFKVSSINESKDNDKKDEIKIYDYVENSDKENNKNEENNNDKNKNKETKEKNAKKLNKDKAKKKIKDSDIDKETSKEVEGKIDKTTHINYPDYKLPPLTLLNKNVSKKKSNKIEYKEKADILYQTLKNFNVEGKIVSITNGPSLTRYEFKPSPGIKVSKIKGLSDDIALKLAVPRVRVAPVPKKAAVGIEVPNQDVNLVNIKQVLNSKKIKDSEEKLKFVLGKDISGKTIVGDLSSMPHLLIAGATGSGKSVCINTIINSILYNATPDEVKFLMIDPKVVELSHYNGIPHLILPVVTSPKKAAIALNWAVKEMEERYEKFAETFTKDLKSYNQKHPDKKMNQIVVIIDELADLMTVAPKKVENSISRIAQKARAAGIHLIVATQRPSVDVITGVIKANIPSRISFAVSSAVDSRTILDEGGAEKLLGKGDMLYKPVGDPKPIRLQGAFISDQEVQKTTEFIKNQIDSDKVDYKEDIVKRDIQKEVTQEVDEYLNEAIKIVVKNNKGSISLLQRKLRVGYNRAARMVDTMEKKNIVGPSNGSKAREVLIDESDLENLEL
ncbi:MAG: DNA translocase FtsK 4TM domain-containing protein [Bacillota bacterium]